MKRLPDRSPFAKALRRLGWFLPGDWLKTFVFLHFIAAPRRALRKFAGSFYRMEQIYEVLREFKGAYKGPFSILEFGTANGYSFAKMLYATRYLGMEDTVTVHAFDSFEGLRQSTDKEDKGLIANDWAEGQYRGNYEILKEHCEKRGHRNFRIHKGYFEDTLTGAVVDEFKVSKPILLWVDCDYYSSTRTVFERMLPVLPTGCVFYFDDFDFNFGSKFTGEARLVHEVNQGLFGGNIELIPDRNLSLDSNRVYRLIRFEDNAVQYERSESIEWQGRPRPISNGSPLP